MVMKQLGSFQEKKRKKLFWLFESTLRLLPTYHEQFRPTVYPADLRYEFVRDH